ncbi:MAG: hypothetical protein A3K60_04250 [Euryarchaeota archaeon RBG_19FT_COMBO_56_21]|nr:MAG: hypothetical protein A3K60_04250 [Euryarchaeota archaeon RBG_19FT_COMBO_56_21]
MAGMIADVGERVGVVGRRRLPGKLVMATAIALSLLVSAIVLENANSGASDAPVAQGWQPKTVYLPQTSLNLLPAGGNVTATYHFRWNDSCDFSTLNWSSIDKTNTGQKYVLGLGAKIWVSRANITANFSIEITQGDGTSLGYIFNYTVDRETPHIYLTGERTFWKWDRTPNVVYDYKVKGSCSIEDAWRNGTWTPEEGITLKFDPEGILVLGNTDFAVQLFVYDILVPEFRALAPIAILLAIAIIAVEKKRRNL